MIMKGVFPTIICILISAAFWGEGCSKSSKPESPKTFQLSRQNIAGFNDGRRIRSENRTPAAEFSFTTPVDRASVPGSFTFKNATGGDIPFNASYKNSDSTVVIQPTSALASLTEFTISVSTALKAKNTAAKILKRRIRL